MAISLDTTAHPGGTGTIRTGQAGAGNGVCVSPVFQGSSGRRLVLVFVASIAVGGTAVGDTVTWNSTPAGATGFTQIFQTYSLPVATTALYAAWVPDGADINSAVTFTPSGTITNRTQLLEVFVLEGTRDGSGGLATCFGATGFFLGDQVTTQTVEALITPQQSSSWLLGQVDVASATVLTPNANITGGAWWDSYVSTYSYNIGRNTSHGTTQLAFGATNTSTVGGVTVIEVFADESVSCPGFYF